MSRRIALFALLLLLLTGRAWAQVPPETTHGELALNFWSPTPDITLDGVDLATELDIETKRFREFRLRAGGAHKFRFSRIPIRYDAAGTIVETSFVFQGRTYSVNAPVSYEFKWDLYRFGYEWDFVRFSHGFIGLVAELKYNKVEATIASEAIGTETTEAKPPVPTIGGIARGYIGDYVSLTGEFTGLKIDRDDFRGKFYDVDVSAQLNFTRLLAAQVGYRSVDVDYLVDGQSGLLKFKGPYFGGTLRF